MSFATADQADDISEIYQNAYQKTAWKVKKEEIKPQILFHIENLKGILVLSNQVENKKTFGFTYIIPVNQRTFDLYKIGKLKDHQIGSEYSLKKGQEQDTYGLIIVAIGLSKKRAEIKFKESISLIFATAVACHLFELCKLFFKNELIPIVHQAAAAGVLRILKKHNINEENHSEEGARIISFDLKNPHYIP